MVIATDEQGFRELVESNERAVRVHCYRLLGSLQDAEDLTQETLLRAWRNLDTFQGRASLRGWLYRIATNACLDELDRRGRRLLPTMVGAPIAAFGPTPAPAGETAWLDPFPDAWLEVADTEPGPEARYEAKESMELAFLAALQRLVPKQRAVLLFRDVLGWPARDAAEALDLSVAATNSLLQRARERVAEATSPPAIRLSEEAERALLERYVRAWEHADVDSFVALLKEDATLCMPPLAEWYLGREALGGFFQWATSPGAPGPLRFVPTRANGNPAFGIYVAGEGAALQAFILHVVQVDTGGIRAVTSYMNPGLFPAFELPEHFV